MVIKIPLGIPLPQESIDMAKGVKHYTKSGKPHKGASHKMPDGSLHSGIRHTKNSVKLYHFTDLPEKARKVARKSWRVNV